MSTNKILLKTVLLPIENKKIDVFCKTHKGIENLPKLAEFLKNSFSVEIVLDPDIIAGFVQDSSNLSGKADGLCRPCSELECAVIFRACFKAEIPFTISAGRSNLTGSATPDGGIIISIIKMLIPEIFLNEKIPSVYAPVGVILEDLRDSILRLSSGRLILPVDPTSRSELAVGGAVACNTSGFTPGDIGSIRSWVKSVDFLFPDGYKIHAQRGDFISKDGEFLLIINGEEKAFPVLQYPRPAIKNASGPYSSSDGVVDFIDLVVGSEGIFGMITGCELKLQQKPESYLDLFFSLPSEEDALNFYRYLKRNLPEGLSGLSALEYFGVNCRKYMEHEERLFHGENQFGIYIQQPLFNKSIEDAAEEWLEIIINSNSSINDDAVIMLDNNRDRAVFLEARHSLPANSLEVVQSRGTYTIMTDTVVPPEKFAEFLSYTHSTIKSKNLDYLSFGHLGDCHLHFQILPEKAQLNQAAEVYDLIIAKSTELGGVYSGEHGTGKRKKRDFIRCYGKEAAEQVRKSKKAVDPAFLLNRGNVIDQLVL